VTERAQILVIGGGLAGAAAACLLARAGRQVVLAERESGPRDKVCGEFLAPEARRVLSLLGIDLAALGAERVDRVRMILGHRETEAALPFEGASLSRRILDEALLVRAAAAGTDLRRGWRATGLEGGPGDWRVRFDAGRSLRVETVLLATGKHDLRGWRRPAGLQGDLVGFKQHLALRPAAARSLAGMVDLLLFDGGYAGVQLVGAGRAALCLVVRRGRLAASGGSWEALLGAVMRETPALARRLEGAVPCTERPLAVTAIPYGWVRRGSEGLWRLGDQAAVVPSFTGEGMALALGSAELAAGSMLAGDSADLYQRRLCRRIRARVTASCILSHALVRTPTQHLLTGLARIFPSLLGHTAAATRLRPATGAELATLPCQAMR
jgi:flavin-dependent dehydrogenase